MEEHARKMRADLGDMGSDAEGADSDEDGDMESEEIDVAGCDSDSLIMSGCGVSVGQSPVVGGINSSSVGSSSIAIPLHVAGGVCASRNRRSA